MAKTNTSASTSSSGSSSSKGASQASSAPKQTVRSGAELREMSNARRAVIVQARQSGTYIPGNTYDKNDSYAYLALGEKGYNQYAQNKRNSIEYSRAIDYLDSGQYNSKDTMKFLNMANQMAGEDGDMVKYNEKTNSLDKTGKWGGSWLELANMLDGLYKENLWDENRNEYNKLDDEKYKLSEEQAKLKQARDNAAKSVSTGMQSGNFLGNYADTLKQVKANDARIAELDTMMSALNDDLLDKFGTDEEKAALQRLRDNKYAKVEVYDWSKYAAESHNKDADQALVNDFMDRFGRPRAYYNSEDRFIAGYESAEAGIKSGLVGAGSLIGKALDSYNATDINAETRGGSVTGAIKTKEEKEAAKQRIGLPDSPATDEYLAWYNSYDHNKDNFENLNAIKLRQLVQPELDNVNEEISAIERRLANIDKSGRVPSDYMNGGIQEEGELVARLKELKKQQTFYNDRLLEAKGQKDETSIGYKLATDYQRDVFNHWDEVTDQLDAKSQEAIAMAKQEASAFGKLLLDMEKTGIEMGFDMVVGTFTGGSLVPMFVRVLGNESAAARRDGASLDQQIAYGLTKASIELGTEKLFGAFSKIGYGKGIAEELSERVVAQLAETPLGRSVVRAMLSMAEEGAEEGIADLLAPLADLWYRKDKSFKELFSEETANFWYDVLLGAAMGGVGFAGGVVTGQNAQANAELYGNEIDADLQARQSIADDTVKAMQDASKGNVAPIRSVADAANAGGTRALTKQNVANAANEGAAKLDRQRENSRPVTKARDKMYELAAKYPNGNIPMEERLTRQEANLLRAAGYPRNLIEEMSIPRGTRLATAEEIAEGEQKRTKGIKGYVERIAGTDITRRGAERGKARDEEKAKAEEQKRNDDTINSLKEVDKSRVDTSGTINSNIKKTAAQNISGAEEQLGIAIKEGQSVTARLSAIENELGITPENGSSITARIDAINKALYGENSAPSENASNAPNSQVSSEDEITQEQTEEKVKPPKESKSKKPKKPKKNKKAKEEEKAPAEDAPAPESNEPAEQSQAEATTEEPPAEPIEQQNSEELPADQQQQEEPPAEEPVEEAEEPTGLEAEIRNAKSLEELISLYNRDKHEFNSLYASKWGGGFAVDNQFAKDDLRNLFNDLHPDKQISSKPVATKTETVSAPETNQQTEVKQEATTEAVSEENNEAEAELETTTEKNKQNALNQIKNFELTQERLIELVNGKVLTMEEAAEAIGHKFHDAKEFVGTPEEIAKKEANRDKTRRQQLKRWYVQEKAKFNSDLLTEEEKTRLETANKVKERSKKQAERVSDERAQDKADEEAGLKAKNKTDDLTNSLSRKIPWREPTDEDYDNIRQWMVDQITKGELTAEEIAELFQKDGHTGDVFSEVRALMQGKGDMDSINEKINSTYSQRLIDLANSELTQRESESGVTQTIIPSMVREYLIRGFNDLTNMDVGLKGESVQLEDIQQALNEWRGKEAPKFVSRVEIRKKAAEQKAARDAAIAKFEAEQKAKTSKKQAAPVVVVQEAQKEASKEKKAKAVNPAAVAKEKTLKAMSNVTNFAKSILENSLPTGEVSAEDAAKIFARDQIDALAAQHKISPAEVKTSLNGAAKEFFGKAIKGQATDAKQEDLVKEINKLRSKGVKKNAPANGVDAGRVISSFEETEGSSRISATEHWTDKSRAAYRSAIESATEKGATFVGYEKTKGATRQVVDRLLNGLPDNERSKIPAVTILDCSKMSKEDYNETVGALGLVLEKHPECGIILFVNSPGKSRSTAGAAIRHEPTHYFWLTSEEIGFDTTTESVLRDAAKKIGNEDAFNKAVNAELAFSGYDILQSYLASGKEITEDEYKSLLSGLSLLRDTKFKELTGENYEYFLDELYEEAGANLAANNTALDEFGIKVGDYVNAMREALYDAGVTPRGYYEMLDEVADEYTAEQQQTSQRIADNRETVEKAKSKKEQVRAAIQTFAERLRNKGAKPEVLLVNPKAEIIQKIAAAYGVTPETVAKEADRLLNPVKTKKLRDIITGEDIPSPHGRAISEASTKYWLGRNVTPEGAINTRTNKEYSKYTTEAERIRNGGPIEYRSISDVSVAKTAGENVFDGLAKYGYEAVAESYKALAPNLVNDKLVAREIVSLAQAIHQELWYRSQHPGKTLHENLAHSNEVLTADEAALWTLARQITGEAASVLRRTTVLTPELQTINNFIQTWAKDKTPESIDQNSDAAKMIQFGQDTVARVKEIEEDFNAGNEEQARKDMINVIKEVNKVRNTRGLFADQIVGGKQLGKAMDFVEASLLNRVLKESDFNTIKMMALGSVNRINSDFEKVGKLNTVNQLRYANMLSNFATTVNNLLNNLESATTGALANNIAYDLLNKKTTRIMGGQTLVRSNNDWFSRLAIRSEKRAKNKELNRYMWTKGAESVLSLMYGLDVDEGKIDLDLGAKHNQNSGELGQLMARYQFLTGLKMQTTDAMAIARAYKAMEININSLPISNERKAELRNLAMQEARTQMYHNEDNGVAKALLKARETLDKAHFGDSSLGLGSILVPFVQVPVNVATRALEATPAGVVFDLARGSIALHQLEVRAKQYSDYQDALDAQNAGKELTDAQKEALEKYANIRKPTDAEVHKAARAIGHAATNASIFAVALLATALKGLKNFDDEDDDELKRLAKEKGWTGLQINMAAMFRPGHEWKDGDPVVGGSWLEVLSIPFAAAYSVANSWMKEDEDGKKGGPGAALLAIAKSPLTTFSQAIDVIAGMPGVDQFYDMWTAYQNLQKYEPDEDKRIAKETAAILQYGANTLASFVIPNSMAMATAGIDNKVRDVYTADNNLQVMGNIIKNKLPYFRGKLPVSRDSLGDVRTYGDNVLMGLVNKSVLPGTGVKIWSRSPLEKEWARLKGEGVGGNLMPKKSAPNNITVDGEKYDFNAEEKRSWDDMNTELCVAGQNILINTEGYQNMTDEEKGAALRDVNTLMALVSNQAALDKKGIDKHVELKGWESAYFGDDNGPDMEGLAKYLVAKHTFKSIWDSKNSTFANLEEADTFIDNIYSKLDQTARDTLDSSYGWLDDFSDARKTTGMSAKEFAAAKEIQEKYRDMQDAMRDMADDDENKESLSALSRNMATEFADYFGDGSKRAKWAQDHLRLWVTISASNDTLEKWQGETSLSTKEIDSWLDNKSKLVPQGGYKNPSQNQTFMAIRDFNGISASNQSDLEKKRWEMIKMAASKGEDTDGDGEGDGGAWAKLKPYMEQGYSVEYALDHATYWYKQGRRWVQRKYNRIYPKD